MKPRILALIASAVLASGTSSAVAATIVHNIETYFLQGFTFNDGGTATGSFTVDWTTSTVTAFDITTSTDSALSLGAHYTSSDLGETAILTFPTSSSALFNFDPPSSHLFIQVNFDPNHDLTLTPNVSDEVLDSLSTDLRQITSGDLAVPGPTAGAGLPGLALAAFGFMALRRRQASA